MDNPPDAEAGAQGPRLWREGRRAQPREKGANMKKLAKALARYAVDLAMVAGATAVAVGAAANCSR